MNNIDKIARVLIAIILALLYYFNIIEGTLAYVLMGIAIVLLITSLVNYCPLYKIIGVSTCKTKS